MKIQGVIRTRLPKTKAAVIALACAVVTASAGGSASACSLVKFEDDGRYVGGDLPTQIATKADTVQIVRVTAKYLVSRTYSQGEWYLRFGDTDVPEGRPEFIDEFVFALEPVETLKAGGDPSDFVYEQHLRVRGFGRELFRRAGADTSYPNRLPDWVSDRPGEGGYAFISASEDAGLGGGECSGPYALEVGQILLALRDSIGRLYPASGAFPLKIDAEFLTGQRRQERLTLNMQSLIPINGPDDAFVARLRQALAARPNATRN
jgi:hypothetical protein